MNAEPVTEWLTGTRARKLLRLYLAWPRRFEATPGEEAGEFHDWLKLHYEELSVVRAIRSRRDIEVFLACNPDVIEAAKFLKPSEAAGDGDVRRETRIRTSTVVYMGIFGCPIEPKLTGASMKGIATDVTSCGLCIETRELVPAHSLLSLTVAPAGYPIMLYRLTGEVRWTQEDCGAFQLGVRLLDADEYDRWRVDFETRFNLVPQGR